MDLKEVLIDDVPARTAAKLLNLTPRGTIFVLLKALEKKELDLDGFLEALNEMIGQGFRLKEEVYVESIKEARRIVAGIKPVVLDQVRLKAASFLILA